MKQIKDPWRLKYHVMPETGWLNDPNGAIQFNGTYHLFYQYVPDNPKGGATHWGHQTSQDMVHFKQEPIFLSPDQTYDRDGVYSGGAIEHNGVLHFFYTGNVKKIGDYDYIYSGREQNVVHVISKDGYTVEQREVLIAHDDFPRGFTDHIRDPKVLELDGVFYMILGARRTDNRGAILLYQSLDLEQWDYQGELIVADEDEGYMWECPDLFFINGQAVLIFSPQGTLSTTGKYHNTHIAGYCLGEVDFKAGKFQRTSDFYELDTGFDFYAPHTFVDDKGRRIQWAWMGLGDTLPEYTNPTINRGWQHAMTLPRELILKDRRIYQRPLTEYQKMRLEEQRFEMSGNFNLELAPFYEAIVKLPSSKPFKLLFGQDSRLIYENEILTLSHGPSGFGRRKRTLKIPKIENLHFFVDTSSVEIFINDGISVMTSRVYPDPMIPQQWQFKGNGLLNYYLLKPSYQ